MKFGVPISWIRPAFTVSTLLIVLMLITQNDAWSKLFRVQNHAVIEAFALGLTGLLLTAIRWGSIGKLFGRHVPFRLYLKWTFAASFGSTFFPHTLEGDSLRTIWLSIPIAGPSEQEHPKARRWRAASIVRWDRFIALMALLLIGIPSLFSVPSLSRPLLLKISHPAISITIIAGGVLTVALSVIGTTRFRERLRTSRDQIIKAGLSSLSQPWRTGIHFCGSIVIHLLSCQALWLLAQSLQLGLGGSEAIDLIVFSGLATVIPISLNGAGLRELIFALYFHLQGWDPVEGALLGVLVTGVQTLISMTGCFHFFQIMNSFRLSVPTRPE